MAISVRVSMAKIKQKQLLWKRIYILHNHIIAYHWECPEQEFKQTDKKAECKSRNWNTSHREVLLSGLRSMTCSGCFHVATKTTSPEVTFRKVRRTLLHQSSINKFPISVYWECSFNWGSIFQNDFSLCKANIKSNSTM